MTKSIREDGPHPVDRHVGRRVSEKRIGLGYNQSDLGRALGCGGCMSSLRRTRAGSFALSQAVTMQQVLDFAAEHDPQELLMPVDAVFSVHPPLIVTLGQAAKLKNGAQVRDWQFRSGTYRVYAEDGEFLLLGRVENGLLTTIKSFFEVNTLAT